MLILAVIAGLLVLFGALKWIDPTWHADGYEASPEEVREELQAILDGDDPHAFDDFTSVGPLADPMLEAIRQRCADLPEEFPRESKEQYFGAKGVKVILDLSSSSTSWIRLARRRPGLSDGY